MAAYDYLKQGDFTKPIEEELDRPTHDATAMKEVFGSSVNELKATINAALDVLGADRDEFVDWREQMQDLLTPDQAANLAAAVVSINATLVRLEALFTPIRVTDLTIATTDFVSYTASGTEETALYNKGYTKRAAVPVTGVLADMYPHVDFDTTTVTDGGVVIPNQYKPYAGGFYVYSDGVPASSIKVLTANFEKAVS